MTQETGRKLTRNQKNTAYQREKCYRVTTTFFPGDADLAAWVDAQDEGKSAYIRRLVREDMERRQPGKRPPEDVKQSFVETSKHEQNKCSDEAADPR